MSVPLRQKAYQGFGDLILEFPGIDEGAVSGYRRDLNLDAAVATVVFEAGGVSYRREALASFPDQVIAVCLTASQPGKITSKASFVGAHAGSLMRPAGEGQLSLSGGVAGGAIRFEARLLVKAVGGSVKEEGGGIAITDADAVTLYLAGATNFRNYRDVSADPRARNDATLAVVAGKSYEEVKQANSAGQSSGPVERPQRSSVGQQVHG